MMLPTATLGSMSGGTNPSTNAVVALVVVVMEAAWRLNTEGKRGNVKE